MSEKVYFPGQIKEEYRGNRTVVLVKNPQVSNFYDGENINTFNYDLLDILQFILTGKNYSCELKVPLIENRSSIDKLPVFSEEFIHMTGEGRKHYPLQRVYMGVSNPIANEIMNKRACLCEGSITFEDIDQIIVKKEFLTYNL